MNAIFLEIFREIDRTATKIRLLNLRNIFLVVNVNFGTVLTHIQCENYGNFLSSKKYIVKSTTYFCKLFLHYHYTVWESAIKRDHDFEMKN